MKYALIFLIMALSLTGSYAQDHNIYADIGSCPGFSVTYNYKLTKRFGIGAGTQRYRLYRTVDIKKFTSGMFVDLRLYSRPDKDNQFFTFLDLGINIYRTDKSYYRSSTYFSRIPHNNGFYNSIGFGYFRRITSRGAGPYASLKLMHNWHSAYGYSIVSNEEDTGVLSANGTFALSLGFKF